MRNARSRRRQKCVRNTSVEARAIELLESRALLTTLTSGQHFSGVLAPGESDEYEISLEPGEQAIISYAVTGGDTNAIRLKLELARPGADFLRLGEDSASRHVIEATTAGVYRVRVSGHRDTYNYEYHGRIARIASPLTLSGGSDYGIDSGRILEGAVERGLFKIVEFRAPAGAHVSFSIADRHWDPDTDTTFSRPQAEIFGTRGFWATSTAHGIGVPEGNFTHWRTEEADTFTAIIRGNNFQGDGEFVIRLHVTNGIGFAANSQPYDGRLYTSGTRETTIPRGSYSILSFNAFAGDHVFVDETLSPNDSATTIVGPNGIGKGSSFTADVSGTHWLLVRDSRMRDDIDVRVNVHISPDTQRRGDMDGDVDFDANDSFLMHLVQLAGSDDQILQSMGSSPVDQKHIRNRVNELGTVADVDGDGDFDANDSFLIHLVKLSGDDAQLDQSKGASSLSASEIRQRVTSLFTPPESVSQSAPAPQPVLADVALFLPATSPDKQLWPEATEAPELLDPQQPQTFEALLPENNTTRHWLDLI